MKNPVTTLRSVLLIISLSLTFLSVKAQTKIGDLYYDLKNSEATVKAPIGGSAYFGDADGNIFVPSVVQNDGQNYTVTKIENGAFQNSTAKHIYLPSTIKTIGDSLFANSSIEELILGDNIGKTTSSSIVLNCADLKSAYLPYFIEQIPSNAFQGCTSLESFAFPTNVETIGQQAFSGTSQIKDLFLSNQIRTINKRAFENTSLEELWFPALINNYEFKFFYYDIFLDSSIKKIVVGNEIPRDIDHVMDSMEELSFYGFKNFSELICAYPIDAEGTFDGTVYFGSDALTVYAPNLHVAKSYKQSPPNEVNGKKSNTSPTVFTDKIILGAIPSHYFGAGSIDINLYNKYKPKTDDDFYITEDFDYKNLTYEIDDESIATINGTIVTFHKAGVVTITARSKDTSKDGREIANPVRKLCIMPNTVTIKLVNENEDSEGTSPKAKFEYSCGWADSNNKGWSSEDIEKLIMVTPGIKNIQIGSGEDEIGSVPYGAQSDCFVFIYDSSTTNFDEINPGGIPGVGGGTLEPAKTDVTVTIENAIIQYKDEIPSPTYTLPADVTEGSEEIKAALEGKLEWNVTGTASPGTYHFKAVEETITSDNYNITVDGINAKLTIEKLQVTVTVVSKTINDTDEVPTPEVTYSVELSETEQTEITTGYGEKLQWEVPLNGIKLTAGTYKIAEIEPFETTHFGVKTDVSNATLTVTKTTETITIPENLPDVLQGLKYGTESIELNLKSNDGIADDVPVEYYIDQANPEGCISINEDGTLLSISGAGKALLKVGSNSDDYKIEDEGRTITVDKYDVEVVVNGVEITDDVQQVPDITFSYNDLPFETDKEAIETALKNILKWNYEKGEDRVIKEGEYGLAEYSIPVMDNYNITINADNAKLKVNRAIDRLILKLESERKSFNVSFSVNAVTKFKYNEEKVADIGKKINIVGYDTNASFYVDYPENITQIVIEDDYTNNVELYGNLTNLEVLDVTMAKNLTVENIKLPEIFSSEIIQTSEETGSKVKKDDENGDDNEGKEDDNNKEGENDDDDNTGDGNDDDDNTGGNDDDDNTGGGNDDDDNTGGGNNNDDDNTGDGNNDDDNTGDGNDDDDDNTSDGNDDGTNSGDDNKDDENDDNQSDVEVVYHIITLDFDETKGDVSYIVTRASSIGENNTVKDGAEVYFAATPYEGYKIGKAELNGIEVNISSGGYRIENVSEDLTFKVLFVEENVVDDETGDDNKEKEEGEEDNAVGDNDDDNTDGGNNGDDDYNTDDGNDDDDNTGGGNNNDDSGDKSDDNDNNEDGNESEDDGGSSSIEVAPESLMNIMIRGRKVYIEGIDENTIVEVVDIKGSRVYAGVGRELELPLGGWYVVRARRETRKILVR